MVQIIGHRGIRNEKPENTLDSIAGALNCPGIHGVEFDIELTGDNQPVVLHQETVVPSADGSRIEPAERNFTSRDWVIETAAAVVMKMDAGSWMSEEFAHVRVPSLEQVLALPWGGVTPYVELKDATYWGTRDLLRPSKIVDAALPYLQRFTGSLNVISFNPEILLDLRTKAPTIPTILALWTEWRGRIDDAIAEADRCGAGTLLLPDTLALEDSAWVEAVHRRDLKMYVYPVSPARGEPEFAHWTPASQAEKWQRLAQLKIDALMSDFPRETLEVLK